MAQMELRLDAESMLWQGFVGNESSFERLGLVDCSNSDFGRMQEPEIDSKVLAGLPGEIVQSYRFSPRGMSLSVISDDGMTLAQKRALQDRFVAIEQYSISQDIRFTDRYHYSGTGRYRNVRYGGGADDPIEHPGWLEITLPLKAYDPLWYDGTVITVKSAGSVDIKGSYYMFPVYHAQGGGNVLRGQIDGRGFEWYHQLGAGETLTADAKTCSASVQTGSGWSGAIGVNWLMYDFMGVSPGTHNLTLTDGCWMEYTPVYL